MPQDEVFAITISRQLGSGGAYLGQRLSNRLGALYMDREILRKAAEKLDLPQDQLESRDETVTPLWKSVVESFACGVGRIGYAIPPFRTPTDSELYQAESKIISRVACEHAAVIVGHGGCHVLREHPRHLSIFLHANIPFRRQRIQDIYHFSEQDAQKMMDDTDRERARYRFTLTGANWTDARHYHLCLDTGVLGLEAAEEVICSVMRSRFGAN
jgi:CMP/dCMP kinase